jgi:predicted O-methyltransferase YrrM
VKWEQDLVKDIRLHDYRDDLDWPLENGNFVFEGELPFFNRWRQKHDFSRHNQRALETIFSTKCPNARCILEIGVSRDTNKSATSTSIFLENKRKNCVYLGVDIESKTYLNRPKENVHTLISDSGKIDFVMDHLRSLGVEQIDFLMIDGWHSINQVLAEWEYTKWLSPNGIVGFHDTAYHPGPHRFVNNIDTTKWAVIPNACAEIEQDYGIGFAWRR